jgi:alpha-ribazole phosphatase
MEIYLIRHTTPLIEKGICYGQYDVPLRETFEKERNQLLSHLPEKPDAVYASPLSRCALLAQFITTRQPLQFDNRLLEMDFGKWEMKCWKALQQEELNHWMNDFVNVKVPGGVSFVDLYNRVSAFRNQLIKKNEDTVIIVTHAGVIRCFVANVLEISLKNAFKIQIDYSSITKIQLQAENSFNKLLYLNKI